MSKTEVKSGEVTQSGLSPQDSAAGRTESLPESGDIAARFLATLDPSVTADEITPEEYRKVLLKVDLIILPLIAGTVMLSAVDKASTHLSATGSL